jgi:hypothetical protein
MAKKITQEDLRKKIGKGAKVDSIVTPKPKKKPKPLIKEQVAEGLNETSRAITEMANVITGAFDIQSDQLAKKFEQIVNKEVVVNLPKQVKKGKKTHVFKVKRDHRGFIEEIIAKEI